VPTHAARGAVVRVIWMPRPEYEKACAVGERQRRVAVMRRFQAHVAATRARCVRLCAARQCFSPTALQAFTFTSAARLRQRGA